MSETNERSVASAGSVGPVAWAVTPHGRDEEIDCEFIYPDAATAGDVALAGGLVVPLYRSPALTETERLAIEWAAVIAKEQSQVAVHKTLRLLLERTK